VGDVVARQHVKVLRREIVLVSDLDGVSEAFRQRLEERIKDREEIGQRGKGPLVERPELEDEGTNLLAVTLESAGKELIEGFGVQEMFVWESGPFPVPRVFRPRLDRDVFRDLETEDKVRRRRVEQLRPVLLSRKLIERQITADRRERLGIFRQAILLELGFGELRPGDVSVR
jgi:hypothetical protein